MKVAVIGCGAIGGLILGYLEDAGIDVFGVIRQDQKEAFKKEGLLIEGIRGKKVYRPSVDTKMREESEFVIFATKTNDLKNAILDNQEYLKQATAITTQNGIGAEEILKEYFSCERIITGIVMFGATFYPPNKIVHNFEGDFVIGNIFGASSEKFDEIEDILNKAFKVSTIADIKGAKYLKLFINLNNCIPAVLGVSMQEAFSDSEISALAIKMNQEAYRVIKKSKISLVSLPTYPKERLEGLLSMPELEAVKLFSKIMVTLSDKPLYGSILQSIKRGRKSEIDFINGEIVRLARANNIAAPINNKLVELVKETANSNKFLTKRELLKEISSLYAKPAFF